MKQIKLVRYTVPDLSSPRVKDKLYSVALGNGYTTTFSTKKETLAFLAETNRELSHKLYEINFVYADVLRAYRLAWPYFDLGSKTVQRNLQGIILDRIADTDRLFNLIVDRANWENGNFHVFSQFTAIVSLLKEICSLMEELYHSRNHPVNMYECKSIITRLDYIHTAIIMYPQKIELVTENRYLKAVMKAV